MSGNMGGQFMVRRVHGLLGIIPVGVFFLMHMFLNSRAGQSPEAYQWVPNTLDQIPFLPFVEIFGIILPLLFHAILGVYIALRLSKYDGPSALRSKYGNFAYVMQR